MFLKHENPTALAMEIFWLAWQACPGPCGMGIFQNKPSATKDSVWNNITNQGDYPCNFNHPSEPYADYVFGRMMKLGLEIRVDGIEIREFEPRSDYQSWCRTYPTVQKLVDTAFDNLAAKNN